SVTFHMAFDEIEDQKSALDQLIVLGIDRVLTKGGSGSALENRQALKELVAYGSGRIVILAGGGITQDNYAEVVKSTGVKEVHGTKIVSKV
ncbi:MAG TPA: copper homeostasis protein CutC, partial [Firmicutes bacterium]|nr:copper homeostasis protein CutC [Bacillota bacterium]